jgi:acrylyl-CoA reductase (NADPH)
VAFRSRRPTGGCKRSIVLASACASEIVERNESPDPQKPLQKARCADAVDSVGSITLTNVLAPTRPGGAVAACGWAGGMDLPISVAPFILGGASLFGIESVMSSIADRRTAWGHLASGLDWESLRP